MTEKTEDNPPDPLICEHGREVDCGQCLRDSGHEVQRSKLVCYFGENSLVLRVEGGSFVEGQLDSQGSDLEDWHVDEPPPRSDGIGVWEGDVWWDTPSPMYGDADIHFVGAWRLPTTDEMLLLGGTTPHYECNHMLSQPMGGTPGDAATCMRCTRATAADPEPTGEHLGTFTVGSTPVPAAPPEDPPAWCLECHKEVDKTEDDECTQCEELTVPMVDWDFVRKQPLPESRLKRRRLEGRELYQAHVVIDGERHQVYVCYNCNIETTSNPCTCGAFVRALFAEGEAEPDGTR